MSQNNFSIKMLMFIRFFFYIYKPNTEAFLELLQSDDAELDRKMKWKEIKTEETWKIYQVLFCSPEIVQVQITKQSPIYWSGRLMNLVE